MRRFQEGTYPLRPFFLMRGGKTMTNFEGWRFEQYTLDWLIGQGGFADVYRAWDDNLSRWVAIKVLRKRLTNDDLKNFFKEARIMANLRHPHIVTVFTFNFIRVLELGRYRKIPYLVMDYAPNGSLAERHLHGELLHIDTILWYLKQIVGALSYIHSCRQDGRGLVHQDVKPANILLGMNDEVLISDFGIARFVQNARLQLSSIFDNEWVGTAIYMAPELFRGQASPATDQYALGIMLFEWLTGRYPFYGTNAEIRWHQIHTPPPSLRTISSDISPAVEQVVLKTLHKNPRSRYKNVSEMLAALEEAAHPPFPRSLISFIRRYY